MPVVRSLQTRSTRRGLTSFRRSSAYQRERPSPEQHARRVGQRARRLIPTETFRAAPTGTASRRYIRLRSGSKSRDLAHGGERNASKTQDLHGVAPDVPPADANRRAAAHHDERL